MEMSKPTNLGFTLPHSAFPVAELVVKQLPAYPWFKVPQEEPLFFLVGWRHNTYLDLINIITLISVLEYGTVGHIKIMALL